MEMDELLLYEDISAARVDAGERSAAEACGLPSPSLSALLPA
jgi:hypothetical protein